MHRKKSHNFLNWLNAQTSNLCFCISVFLLIPLLIFISTSYDSPPPYIPNRAATAAIPYSKECPSGRVYAYDLPSMFNNDLLLHNCTDLDHGNSQCGIGTNHGLGGAATELRRVLPKNLSNSWYRTNQFSLELIFHRRILQHKCRTLKPETATAFYIPFYAGLAMRKYGWFETNDIDKRDFHCMMLLCWIQQHPYWKKSKGSDHFVAIGRPTWDFRRPMTDGTYTWGSAFLNMSAMSRVTRFIVEKSVDDDRDVSVPWPTGFHPGTRETLEKWQNFARAYNRSSLFTFVGGPRPSFTNDFRGILLRDCSDEPLCRAVDCKAAHCETDSSVVLESFLGSEFCLQPRGDSSTRRSVFDCMIAGSVPVIFWRETMYGQYEWVLPGGPGSYSVFIDHEKVRNRSSIIKEVLMGYSKEEIRKMREKVIESIPRIIYGIRNEGSNDFFKDAFDIALDGVLERIKKEREISHDSSRFRFQFSL